MNRKELTSKHQSIRTSSPAAPAQIDRRTLLKAGGTLGLATLALGALPRSIQQATAYQGTPSAAATPVLGPQADGTNLWKVQVGGMDMENKLDLQGFFPGEITINAGDQIWFSEAMPGLHNAWFGYGAEAPALLIPDPEIASPAADAPPQMVFNPAILLPTPSLVVDGVNPVNTGVDILWDPTVPTVVTFSTPGTYDYLGFISTVTADYGGGPFIQQHYLYWYQSGSLATMFFGYDNPDPPDAVFACDRR